MSGRRRENRVNAVASAVAAVARVIEGAGAGGIASSLPSPPAQKSPVAVGKKRRYEEGEDGESEAGPASATDVSLCGGGEWDDEEVPERAGKEDAKAKKWEYVGIRHDGSFTGDAAGTGFDCDDMDAGRGGHLGDEEDCFLCKYGHNDRSGHVAQITNMITNRVGHVADRVLYRETGMVQRQITECLFPRKRQRGDDDAASAASPGLEETDDAERRQRQREASEASDARRQVENHNKYHSLNPEVICAENARYVRQIIRMHASRLVRRDPDTLLTEPNPDAVNGLYKGINAISNILKLKPKQLMFNPSVGGGS